jgi:hypothetical protein
MNFSFQLTYGDTVHEISEPDGWKGSKIKLERHQDFYSLIEFYEGSAGGAFIFYGDNGVEDGGISFLKSIEQADGFDQSIGFIAGYSPDGFTFENIFSGLVDLSAKNEMENNKMQAPVIRDDFWSKFINRKDTPVSLSSTTDLDGNPVDPVTPVTIRLTPQPIKKLFYSWLTYGVFYENANGVDSGDFQSYGFDHEEINEFDSSNNFGYYNLLSTDVFNDVIEYNFAAEYSGNYDLDICIELALNKGATLPDPIAFRTTNYPSGDRRIRLFFQINEQTPIEFTITDNITGAEDSTSYTYFATHALNAGDQIRIYGDYQTIWDSEAFDVRVVSFGSDDNTYSGASIPTPSLIPSGRAIPTYFRITGHTILPETEAQGYLLHDAISGVLERYGLGESPLYSEFLGSALTNSRSYPEDGCGWKFAILKGLQIRDYSLEEKPFFISFNQLWEGANPILNLALGYEEIEGDQVIRIEQKADVFDEEISVSFGNVSKIKSSYDTKHIFKTLRLGYKKWQSEDILGIDDPQTKRVYATRFEKSGTDLTLESDFIAASLAFETTRRAKREKSVDYKFDNDTFILALSEDEVSPQRYRPELAENFNSVTNLLDSSERYNLILTPMRNLLRWANVFGGCLQKYLTSSYRFVSGEGNYDMVSDYSCALGNVCEAIICDSLTEKQDIPLSTYNGTFGYLFYPMIYEIEIPMEWDDFNIIRNNPKNAIGISQTDEDYKPFFIKELEYDIVKGTAVIKAWPKEYFDIQVIETEYQNAACPIERSLADSDDNPDEPFVPDEVCYRLTEDGDIRITEDNHFRITEICDDTALYLYPEAETEYNQAYIFSESDPDETFIYP